MKQYSDKIDKILAGVQDQISECAAKIAAAKTVMDQSDKDMSEAIISGDDVAYKAAKEKREQAATSHDVALSHMDVLKNGALISKEEYENMVGGILSKMNEANDRDKKEAVKLCEKLLAIADRNLHMIEEGDALLYRLQFDVYRAADMRDKNGNIIPDYSGNWRKQFKDRSSLNGWAHYALRDCVQYAAFRDSVIEEP